MFAVLLTFPLHLPGNSNTLISESKGYAFIATNALYSDASALCATGHTHILEIRSSEEEDLINAFLTSEMIMYMCVLIFVCFDFLSFSECHASADVWLGVDWAGEQLLWASDGALVSDGYTNWKGAAVELSNCVKKESADRGSQWSLSS